VGETREHTGSWYAATRRNATDYPALRGEHRCDVAVVGAGFSGVSASLFLAERGYDVALIEANRVGWGASGRNGGQLIAGFTDAARFGKKFGPAAATMVRQMGLECRDILVARVAQYTIDCDLKFGYLDVAARGRPAELRNLEAQLQDGLQNDYPHALRLIRKDELDSWVRTDSYVAGLSNAGNGHLHPLNLCIGEARAASELGATIFEQTRVTRIRHGARPVIETETGKVFANKVILAGNAYLRAAEPKLRNTIFPAGSYMIATEPLSERQVRALLPADAAYCEQQTALNYFRLSPDRRLLFGGMCNYSGRHPKNIAASLRPRLAKIFPSLANVRVDYQWGGNIAISINRIPQFGRIQGNTYYVQGYSGHGVAPTHIAGKMLADIVGGDSEQFDLFARVRHLAIPGGKWFASPAVALGMMYYRIKELLA
jgi:glycine/D-amino acid oxidase-like deaminating enzyme